jgi:hypothetical protein
MNIKTKNICTRIDNELYKWILQQCNFKNCRQSDLFREAILMYKTQKEHTKEHSDPTAINH